MTRSVPTAGGIGPRSDLFMRDARSIASAQKQRFFPLAPVSGHGATLVEADGRELIDLSGSWGAVGLGHAHPAVVAAVTRAVSSMPGASALSQINAEAVGLAEELIASLPGNHDRSAYLGLSGSDANAAALRCARAFTGRQDIIAFEGSYHGGLGPAQEISGIHVAAGEAAAPGLRLLPYPVTGDLAAAATRLDAAFDGHEVAAVIVEPVMSDGGVHLPPAGFLSMLRDRCTQDGTVMICDEVKVGMGRTGTLHSFRHENVVPDVVTFGKALGGGLPASAAVGRSEVMNAAPSSTLLTTAGNPISCAAGRAVLSTVITEGLPARAAYIGDTLLAQLAGLLTGHELVTAVRGRGLIAGVELVADNRIAAKVALRAYELGIVLYYVGPGSNVLELTPPLVIDPSQLARAIDILDTAITDVEAGHIPDSAIAQFAGW